MKDLRSDNEIIKEIKNHINATENFKIISDRHSAIFFKMASKYISKKFREKRLEFFRDKDYYIYRIILDFKFSKNTKFSTYLANRIKWMCMNSYHKDCNNQEIKFSTETIANFKDESKKTDYNSILEIMNLIKSEKDDRIYKIFKFRYLEGKNNSVMPWKEISQKDGINLSVQGCINIHNKYLKKIRKER